MSEPLPPLSAPVTVRDVPPARTPVIPPPPGRWVLQARCKGANPALFFPSRGGSLDAPRALCDVCLVRDDCAAYARATRLPGVWAGTSKNARHAAETEPPSDAAPRAAPSPTPTGELQRLADSLVAHPGRWARLARWSSPHSAGAAASRLRPPPGVPSACFSTRVVSRRDHSLLYARVDLTPPP